eukprot:433912_1
MGITGSKSASLQPQIIEEKEKKEEESTINGWKQLKSLNCNQSNTVHINDKEFVVATRSGGIYKYSIKKNAWKLLTTYPAKFQCIGAISFDHQTKILYVYGWKSIAEIKIDENDATFCTHKTYHHVGQGGGLLFINSTYVRTLNIFGGMFSNQHSTINIFGGYKKKYEIWSTLSSNIHHGIIFLSSQNTILLLGGYSNYKPVGKTDEIWSHKIGSTKWEKLSVHLPEKNMNFGCVVTKKEKYIIILGGNINDTDIYYMNLKTKEFKKSTIKCPSYGGKCSAIIVSNIKKENELLLCGYIKCFCNKNDNESPKELIKLILMFYEIQYIHYNSSHNHSKICVDDIINCS